MTDFGKSCRATKSIAAFRRQQPRYRITFQCLPLSLSLSLSLARQVSLSSPTTND